MRSGHTGAIFKRYLCALRVVAGLVQTPPLERTAMLRNATTVSSEVRTTDLISLGVIAKTFRREQIDRILAETGRNSKRQRSLPAHVVMYYVIALALFMDASYGEVLRCLLEGIRWFGGSNTDIPVAAKSSISEARTKLGWEPVKKLHDEVVAPIATIETRGAYYRGRKLVSLDGSTLDVADTEENENEFGRPSASRGTSAYPQIRFVSLVENGTHVLFGSELGPCKGKGTGESTLAKKVLVHLKPGMLCLADRLFYSYELWKQAKETNADLLWRVKNDLRLPREQELPDGSYLSTVYPSQKDKRHKINGIVVRVMEYTLDGIPDAEPLYRLITTILDPEQAPAVELAALYHDRWEIENSLGELKTRLRGAGVVLRSKTPNLVRQEFYGLMMAHFSVRGLMHEAALRADKDPDELSFLHAVRVVRRKLPMMVAFPPSGFNTISQQCAR